jgi:ABC-type oligopeptide transport system ATPase subunit
VIKNDPPVGTILTYGQVQAIYDNAIHAEFKNQLKAVLVSVNITNDQYSLPLENFSFIRDDNGYIRLKDVRK